MRLRISCFALALLAIGPLRTVAQELRCNFVLNVENIPPSSRDNLRDFEAEVKRYFNNTKFTDEDMMGEKIDCTITIFLKTVSDQYRYQGQVFIGSQRPVYDENTKTEKISPVLRILDERTDFTYIPGQRMIQDDLTFDPLTDLLDYYAYVIIGFDLETYTARSGDRYFQKALNICNIAQSSAYASAWQQTSSSYSRFGLADELGKAPFDPFRAAFCDYHFDGLDMLTSKPEAARRIVLQSLATIWGIKQRVGGSSVLIKQFFDAKYKEIADVFLGEINKEVYDQLSNYDQEHRSTYQEYKTKNQ